MSKGMKGNKFFQIPKGYRYAGVLKFTPSAGPYEGGEMECPILENPETGHRWIYTKPLRDVCPIAAQEVDDKIFEELPECGPPGSEVRGTWSPGRSE